MAWAGPLGSYGERAVVPAAEAVPVPDSLSDEQAAGALLQGLTAHAFVVDAFPVQAGQDVLIHAAAGGLGLLLTQLASARGARVIGTVSTPEKAELARGAGAAEIVNYSETGDVAAAVRELTDGAGVHVVYDGVGADTFDASLAALRRRGMLVLCGAASGPVPPVDPQRLNAAGSVYLTRPKMFDYVATREELLARAAAVYAAVADGTLDVRIGGRYRLEDVRQAHEDLEGRRTTGKLLLDPLMIVGQTRVTCRRPSSTTSTPTRSSRASAASPSPPTGTGWSPPWRSSTRRACGSGRRCGRSIPPASGRRSG